MWLESLYFSSKNFATWSILFRYTALLPGFEFRPAVIKLYSLTFAGKAHGDDVCGNICEIKVVTVHLEDMFTRWPRNQKSHPKPPFVLRDSLAHSFHQVAMLEVQAKHPDEPAAKLCLIMVGLWR